MSHSSLGANADRYGAAGPRLVRRLAALPVNVRRQVLAPASVSMRTMTWRRTSAACLRCDPLSGQASAMGRLFSAGGGWFFGRSPMAFARHWQRADDGRFCNGTKAPRRAGLLDATATTAP